MKNKKRRDANKKTGCSLGSQKVVAITPDYLAASGY